uniref:C-C motif chemokine n=1 Tax=Mola mola TaxID=94237 RepID=A0A3Q3XQL2_MOLML
MRFNILFFVLIVSCLCLAMAQVNYEDCCLTYMKKMRHRSKKHAVGYRLQITDGSCNIPAVIFTTKRGLVFCTDPRESWVKDLMMHVDKKHNKGNKIPHGKVRPSRG